MIVRLWLAVLMAELLTVVAYRLQPSELFPHGFSSNVSLSDVGFINPNTSFAKMVYKHKTKFFFLIHQDTKQNMSLTVTPCNARLNWYLKFIPLTRTNQTMTLNYKLFGNNDSSDVGHLLVEFTGVSRPVTYDHGKAYKGLYMITAQAIDDESLVMFYVSLKQKTNNQFGFRPNVIKIKQGGQKVRIRWNPSQINQHSTKYSLVISASKIFLSLCEAESRLKEKENFNLTSDNVNDEIDDHLEVHHLEFSTSYILTDLIYDKTYYFTVFAMDGSRMAIQYASATYKFQRPRPIGLKDARPKKINLRALSGKASFRYKIGNKLSKEGSNQNTLYWYVISCSGVVTIEIRCRKASLVKKRIFGFEKITLNNTTYGERYVLKVETVSADETQRVKSIEVMATVRPMTFPFPDMPSDLSIRQYDRPNDCQSVTIGWLPANSYTGLWYCVYVQEYRPNNSIDFSVKPDQCELPNNIRRKQERNIVSNLRKTGCYIIDRKQRVLVKKISKLKPSTTYVVQVTVTKPKGRTLSYDLLKLDTNSCGLDF